LLIDVYDFDVFGDARRGASGHITVDFLNGTISDGRPSQKLAKAVQVYRDALSGLCQKHRILASEFTMLTARYWTTATTARFSVTVRDRLGRVTCTEYQGRGGARLKVLDSKDRIRPTPVKRFRQIST
jgi:hypothetical protein